MRILVTGSEGMIGRTLVPQLFAAGHDVYGCDLTPVEFEGAYAKRVRGRYYRCDIGEFRQIERLVADVLPDMVINCAAVYGRWFGEDYYEALWRTNAVGFRHLLELAREYGVKLLHCSSSLVYGTFAGPMSEDVLETYAMTLENDYAISKRVNEWQGRIAAAGGVDVKMVRFFNTYGPGEVYSPYRSVIAQFLWHMMRNEFVTVHRGHQRQFTYVEDTARAVVMLAEKWPVQYATNVVSGELVNMEDLALRCLDVTRADPALLRVSGTESMTTGRKQGDDTLIRKLGWKPTVGLDEGLERTYEWLVGRLSSVSTSMWGRH